VNSCRLDPRDRATLIQHPRLHSNP
jgi:hypothetical protein